MPHLLEEPSPTTSATPAEPSTAVAPIASDERQVLGQIAVEKRITFQPVPNVLPSDEAQAERVRRGGLILVFGASLFALAYGLKYFLAALFVFLVFYIIGVSTGLLTKSIAERISRQRVRRSGGVDFAGYSLTLPINDAPHTFNLQEPHTIVRQFEKTGAETATRLFIAQGDVRAVLISNERTSSEVARDYGFTADQASMPIPVLAPANQIEVPLTGLLELSRLLDSKRKMPQASRSGNQ